MSETELMRIDERRKYMHKIRGKITADLGHTGRAEHVSHVLVIIFFALEQPSRC